MPKKDRPDQINIFLKTLFLEGGAEMSAELEAYIADLEAKQPVRPSRIVEILRGIGARYPADIEGTLEAYIVRLEAEQQPLQANDTPQRGWDPDNPPIWSQHESIKRERRRRERALKKQNDYR